MVYLFVILFFIHPSLSTYPSFTSSPFYPYFIFSFWPYHLSHAPSHLPMASIVCTIYYIHHLTFTISPSHLSRASSHLPIYHMYHLTFPSFILILSSVTFISNCLSFLFADQKCLNLHSKDYKHERIAYILYDLRYCH